MGRRGPRPLSAAARQARGSRPKAASGTPAAATGVPVMPNGLTGTEEAAWREIVALLEPRGVLTPCDAPMVELTAKTIVTMRHADAVITREGSTVRTASGYLQQRPEVAMQHKARLLLKQLLGELGMSPTPHQLTACWQCRCRRRIASLRQLSSVSRATCASHGSEQRQWIIHLSRRACRSSSAPSAIAASASTMFGHRFVIAASR